MVKTHTTLSINSDLLKKAKIEKINISGTLEEALTRKLNLNIPELNQRLRIVREESKLQILKIEEEIQERYEDQQKRSKEGKLPFGEVHLSKNKDGELRWNCPSCEVCKNSLFDRKCVREGCHYQLTNEEWKFVKNTRRNDGTNKT